MSLGGVMCINKGTLDAMDDDELAYIMAHELVHGEKRHSVNGVKKKSRITDGAQYLSWKRTRGWRCDSWEYRGQLYF